ncbi:MAG: hypothetical protein EHM49_00900 [Deltaproteobacteria bacterium]|nr:MAG: hypothetical protein EHM49_00900 [Deltaproteobacteria bacterium]
MAHLDSEYRNRWEEFYLSNGVVEDSREKNWRDVEWDKVEKILVSIEGVSHEVNSEHKGFKGFMNFRWGGQEAVFADDGTYVGHKPIKIWTVGWTDGKDCFLKDIDFFTGETIKEYVTPLEQFRSHIHPALAGKLLRV